MQNQILQLHRENEFHTFYTTLNYEEPSPSHIQSNANYL